MIGIEYSHTTFLDHHGNEVIIEGNATVMGNADNELWRKVGSHYGRERTTAIQDYTT